MNRTIRVSAAGDTLTETASAGISGDVLLDSRISDAGEVRTVESGKQRYRTAAVTHRQRPAGTWLTADTKCLEDTLRYGFNFLGFRIIIRWIIPTKDLHLRSAN